MQFSIIAVHVLFTFIQNAFIVSAKFPGYDCDDTFIPGERLEEIVQEVYKTKVEKKTQRVIYKLSRSHNGPPFMHAYTLWPVSPTKISYNEAEKTPYRAVIDEKLYILSVVMKEMDGPHIKECKMRGERTNSDHVLFDFNCLGGIIPNQILQGAAQNACPGLRVFATQVYPARLSAYRMDKSHRTSLLDEPQRHLYIFPVSLDKQYKSRLNPGTKYVVIDSACKVISAVEETQNSDYVECRAVLPSSSRDNRYPGR